MKTDKNFEFGGSVFINDWDRENNTWFLVQKFGYAAYIVDDDINAMRNIEDSQLVQLSLYRKVVWYEVPYGRPNLRQFKELIGVGN